MQGSSHAGYDFAAIWLNLVKILIGLVFVYQQTVGMQLGMSLFGEQGFFYVFYTQLAENSEPEETDSVEPGEGATGVTTQTSSSVQTITFEDPSFVISYLPLTLLKRYHHGYIVIYKVRGPTQKVFESQEPANSRRFDWPGKGENALQLASFDLRALLGDEPASGEYQVSFGVTIYANEGNPERLIGLWPREPGPALSENQLAATDSLGAWNELDISTAGFQNQVQIQYQRPPECIPRHYGPLSIVEGRSSQFPPHLRAKNLKGIELSKRPEGGEWLDLSNQESRGAWISVDPGLISIDNSRHEFKARSIRYDGSSKKENVYQLTVCYADSSDDKNQCVGEERRCKSGELMAKISFLAGENLPPRPVYEVEGRRGRITLVYPKDAYTQGGQERKERFEYFNLDRFIVDPDGVTSLRPARMTITENSPTKNYTIIRDPKSGSWRLKIEDTKRVAPNLGPNKKVREENITLKADDESRSSTISVVIQKDKSRRGL